MLLFKFTLCGRKSFMAEFAVLIASLLMMLYVDFYPSIALSMFYIFVCVFFNSIFTHNLRFSVIQKANLRRKPIGAKIYSANALLYAPICIFLITAALVQPYIVLCVLLVVLYQAADIVLLKVKAPIYAYFASFAVTNSIAVFLFVNMISRVGV